MHQIAAMYQNIEDDWGPWLRSGSRRAAQFPALSN